MGKDRFQLPMLAGEILLKNGAEIFRVEQTIERMALALGAQRVDVMAVLSGIQASFTADNQVYTYIRRIRHRRTGLSLIAKVNHVSREFCSGNLTFEQAQKELNLIDASPTHSSSLKKALAAGLGALCFSLLFGLRNPLPLILATLNGSLASIFVDFFSTKGWPEYLTTFVTGFLLASLTLFYPIASHLDADRVLLAALFLILPGVPLSTTIRELTNGDLISGTARLAETLITLITIAAGVYTAFTILQGRFNAWN